jgi:hypothetical protein
MHRNEGGIWHWFAVTIRGYDEEREVFLYKNKAISGTC